MLGGALTRLLCGIIYWLYLRRASWQIRWLAFRLNRLIRQRRRNTKTGANLLRQVHIILQRAIRKGAFSIAYQAIDLLKLTYGEKIFRPDEPSRLMSLAAIALQSRQPDITGYVLEAFRQVYRHLDVLGRISVFERLTLIAFISLKTKQLYMIAKVADTICILIDRETGYEDKNVLIAAIRSLKTIGLIALRRRDEALLREIISRYSEWQISLADLEIAAEVVGIVTAWLHRIIKINDDTMLRIVLSFSNHLVEEGLAETELQHLIKEWKNLAGTASLNTCSVLAPQLCEFLIHLAEKRHVGEDWKSVIDAVGQVAKLSVSRNGIREAFPVLYPLLDAGRRLLLAELRNSSYRNEIRQANIYHILRESLMIVTLEARQNLTSTTGEIIAQLYNCWAEYPNLRGNTKSAKKFCQLLLLYWVKTRQRQARRGIPEDLELVRPELLSEADKEHLGL